ncbi:alpha/beta fold hydrolase [Altererythrobacter sp. SALINAS58]|uniref:haloalkane dehalogenase n=1 Tax=Alteripontixanthobacter muriae TaxID=2705546 RepID=UPI001577539C|nr:haloalkane dehalogenase [Alteripontixanthobacter muriae]NTZ41694.1 alpha/beta fold hydrolase [Alteripontixanthobacter muriae]
MIKALRTPDERFNELPDYNFAPHHMENLRGFDGLRMHYLDEGARNGSVFLCLHGQPTWSYLYRKMIPVFAQAGRVIAPDLFGFGRSDKPVDDEVYTFDFHRNSLLRLIEALDLENITLVCQDWGGLLGLTLPVEFPERFERLIVMNTGIGTGERPLGDGFEAWKLYNRSQPDLAVGALVKRATPILSDDEVMAYDAPFPDVRYKGGVRRFPELVPPAPDAPGAERSRQARDYLRDEWAGKSFMAVGKQDPVITPNAMQALRAQIRGCPEPMLVEDAGHFVQEWGEPVARAALRAFEEPA